MNEEKSINKIKPNPKLLIASVTLREKILSSLKSNDITLSNIDLQNITETLNDVLLGKTPINTSVNTIIENAVEYEDVSNALDTIYNEVFKDLSSELKTYPMNTDPASQIFIENMFSQMPVGNPLPSFKTPTAQILSGNADEPIQDVPHTDAKQLLNEIENPTPSIAQPEFVLPKSKPSTSDILRGILTPTDEVSVSPTAPAPAAPATSTTPATPSQAIGTSLADSLDLSTNTENIIDPFKPQAPMPSTTPNIGASMGDKLSGITGSVTKESYKIVPQSEKARPMDPYREPIE